MEGQSSSMIDGGKKATSRREVGIIVLFWLKENCKVYMTHSPNTWNNNNNNKITSSDSRRGCVGLTEVRGKKKESPEIQCWVGHERVPRAIVVVTGPEKGPQTTLGRARHPPHVR